jgi:hypothetical protein
MPPRFHQNFKAARRIHKKAEQTQLNPYEKIIDFPQFHFQITHFCTYQSLWKVLFLRQKLPENFYSLHYDYRQFYFCVTESSMITVAGFLNSLQMGHFVMSLIALIQSNRL